ncbi:MAG: hypothetical protein ACI8SE_000994 [Bacteroidia bacterium]|jgi:hypothetical protein
MNKFITTLLFLGLLVALGACEKVVQLNVPNADPIVVIESQLSNRTELWNVNLSLTQPYFDQSGISFVDDAIVYVEDNNGNVDTLVYDTDGNYVSKTEKTCVVGNTYTLRVKHGSNTYSSTEKCSYQDSIDFIQSYYLPERNGFIPVGYYIFEKANEYEPEGDFYLWNIYRAGELLTDSIGYLIDTDEFRETGFFNIGIDPDDPLKDIDRGVFPRPFPWSFEKGDSVTIEQLRISEAYYNFVSQFATQQQRSGTPFDPPPFNPTSNIKGGAYGFFRVVNISSKSIVVTE